MITDHAYVGELRSGASCQYQYPRTIIAWKEGLEPIRAEEICGRQAMEHEEVEDDTPSEESFPFHQIKRDGEAVVASALGSNAGLHGKATSPEAEALENMHEAMDKWGADRRLPVRAADAAQYARPAIPADQRGQIRVRLLNATPDPLGSVAALIEQYKGNVIRSLAEVTDEQRRAALADMSKTVLSGPLEAVQFHWQIEGVTRSITHQMVRSRASFFAQESLRFAVPEGDWWKEIPRPPWLSKAEDSSPSVIMWKRALIQAQETYEYLLDQGCPAEEARGILPHDMPTRIHWVCDLRTLLAEAGKRTCTQAQFPWRLIFAGMASALRERGSIRNGQSYERTNIVGTTDSRVSDGWQFREIANALRPVCFQTGKCGFMAQFDRSCKIRDRVDANAKIGRDPEHWGSDWSGWLNLDGTDEEEVTIKAIHDYEWAADPTAARS